MSVMQKIKEIEDEVLAAQPLAAVKQKPAKQHASHHSVHL
jgi:hypothetical protein